MLKGTSELGREDLKALTRIEGFAVGLLSARLAIFNVCFCSVNCLFTVTEKLFQVFYFSPFNILSLIKTSSLLTVPINRFRFSLKPCFSCLFHTSTFLTFNFDAFLIGKVFFLSPRNLIPKLQQFLIPFNDDCRHHLSTLIASDCMMGLLKLTAPGIHLK